MGSPAGLYRRFAHRVHELATFCSIGTVAFVIVMACVNLFHGVFGVGQIVSTGLAIVIATFFAYFANRRWTFRHQENSGLRREITLFFALNGVGLVITEIFVGVNGYVLAHHDKLSYNVANVIGTAAATMFRYWSYKRWVFLRPAAQLT
jgi:putative flippase GtrA